MALAVPHVGGDVTHSTGASGNDPVTSDSWTSTSGSLIVVVGHAFDTSGAAANGDVTDSKSNSYTLVNSSLGGASSVGSAMYYNNAGTRGASHTVTFNAPGTAPPYDNIAVIEITGQDGSAPLDSTTKAVATDGTSPFAVTSAASISGNQIAIYGVTVDNTTTATWTQPTGYSNIINNGDTNFLGSLAAYKINETGTPSPAASSAVTVGSSGAREVFATFKEAAGATTWFGTSQLDIHVGYTTAGKRTTFAASTFPAVFTFTSAATRKTFASTTTPIVVGYTTAATRKTFATSTFPVVVGYTTAGLRKVFGASTFPIVVSYTTAGKRTATGASSFPIHIGYTTTAKLSARGSSTLPIVFSYTTTGTGGAGAARAVQDMAFFIITS